MTNYVDSEISKYAKKVLKDSIELITELETNFPFREDIRYEMLVKLMFSICSLGISSLHKNVSGEPGHKIVVFSEQTISRLIAEFKDLT